MLAPVIFRGLLVSNLVQKRRERPVIGIPDDGEISIAAHLARLAPAAPPLVAVVTENALLCASLARGSSVIWGPHIRPEVLDLVKMLRRMGARIEVFGQERIEVEGAVELDGTNHDVIADNMEALPL